MEPDRSNRDNRHGDDVRSTVISPPDPMPALPRGGLWALPYIGKPRSSPSLIEGESTAVFIVAGQSLAGNHAEGLYTPVNSSKVDNLSLHNGGTYVATDPLLGCDLATLETQRANTFTRVADHLVTNGTYDRVILVPCAVGATRIAQWVDNYYTWIVGSYRRAGAVGLPITGILWQQGETDAALGTSKSTYVSSFNILRAKVVAAGCAAPWIIAKSTYLPGGAINAPIRAAVDELVDGVDVFMGPDCDVLGSSNRYDDQHWNAAGNAAAAALWVSAIQSSPV